MTNGRVANPYRLLGRATFWEVIAGELWVRVLGVRGVWSYDSPWFGLGWGGSASGPPNPSLDPWAASDYMAGLRDSGYDNGANNAEGHDSGDPKSGAQYDKSGDYLQGCRGGWWEELRQDTQGEEK